MPQRPERVPLRTATGRPAAEVVGWVIEPLPIFVVPLTDAFPYHTYRAPCVPRSCAAGWANVLFRAGRGR